MFIEDYRELGLLNADEIAKRCFLFQEFVEDLLSREPTALKFNSRAEKIIVHVHCHAKALSRGDYMRQLVERLPDRTVELLDTGCCGMAGSFGMLESKYDLSLKIAEPLVQVVRHQPFGTTFVTSGSIVPESGFCIWRLPINPRHLVEVLADLTAIVASRATPVPLRRELSEKCVRGFARRRAQFLERTAFRLLRDFGNLFHVRRAPQRLPRPRGPARGMGNRFSSMNWPSGVAAMVQSRTFWPFLKVAMPVKLTRRIHRENSFHRGWVVFEKQWNTRCERGPRMAEAVRVCLRAHRAGE